MVQGTGKEGGGKIGIKEFVECSWSYREGRLSEGRLCVESMKPLVQKWICCNEMHGCVMAWLWLSLADNKTTVDSRQRHILLTTVRWILASKVPVHPTGEAKQMQDPTLNLG